MRNLFQFVLTDLIMHKSIKNCFSNKYENIRRLGWRSIIPYHLQVSQVSSDMHDLYLVLQPYQSTPGENQAPNIL